MESDDGSDLVEDVGNCQRNVEHGIGKFEKRDVHSAQDDKVVLPTTEIFGFLCVDLHGPFVTSPDVQFVLLEQEGEDRISSLRCY